MSLLRNQYPAPVESGGLEGDGNLHAMRNYLGYVRQPDLGQAPRAVGPTGFGTGGGAGIGDEGSEADQSQGIIFCRVGLNPAASGTCPIYFPVAPAGGQYRVMADWAAVTPTVSVNQLLIAWTATRPLVPGEVVKIAYQWAVST